MDIGISDTEVSVGDTIQFLRAAGIEHEIVEVVHETDANGLVTFTTPGMAATVQRYAGYPIYMQAYNADDIPLSAFVIECKGGYAGKYLLGVQHPALGMRIQPSAPTAGPLNETFTACGTCSVRLLNLTTPEASARVTIIGKRQTVDGEETIEIGANHYAELSYDSGLGAYVPGPLSVGEWTTDASGYVKAHNVAEAAWEPLLFPLWPGNSWGTDPASQKVWDGSAQRECSEYLDKFEFWYKGLHLDVNFGDTVDFQVGGASIQFTGTPGWVVTFALRTDWGAGSYRWTTWGTVTIPAGGSITVNDLYEGQYIILVSDPATSNYSKRAYVDTTAGQTTTHACDTPGGNDDSWAYLYDAEPAAGVEVWTSDGTYLGTTDANGYFDSSSFGAYDNSALVIRDPDWGIQEQTTRRGDYCLGGRLIIYDDSIWKRPWLTGDANQRTLYLECQETGDKYTVTGGYPIGQLSEAMPRNSDSTWHPGSGMTPGYWETPTRYHYDLKSGTETLATGLMIPGMDSPADFWACPAMATKQAETVGGRVNGELTHLGVTDEQIDASLAEAARMGLERGGWSGTMGLRVFVAKQVGSGYESPQTAYLGQICPVCAGPVWRWPSKPGVAIYGYCQNCAAAWSQLDATECRTYFETPTIGAGTAKSSVLAWPPTGAHRVREELLHWYRPVEYAETSSYETQSGRGMTTNAPRWFNADDSPPVPEYHPRLAAYEAGTFTQDETASSIKTTLGITDDVYLRPKVEVKPGTTHSGETTYQLTFLDANGNTISATCVIPDGRQGRNGGDWPEVAFLTDAAVMAAEYELKPWKGCLLVTECTGVTVLNGPTTNSIYVVADSPAFVDALVPVENEERTPFVLPFWPHARGLDMFRQPAGNVTWTVWIDGDDIKIAETSSGLTTLATPVTIDSTGLYDYVSAETDGSTLIVDARRRSDHKVCRWYSQDHGATWTGPTVVT